MNLALLMTTKIILGTMSYSEVPNKLKEQVKQNLIEIGCDDLVTEEIVE